MSRAEFDTRNNPRPWERISFERWEHVRPPTDGHEADPHYVGTAMFVCHDCGEKVRVKAA